MRRYTFYGNQKKRTLEQILFFLHNSQGGSIVRNGKSNIDDKIA